MPGFYRSCIDAFRESSYEIILPVGKDTDSDSLGSTPPHIYQSVDQITVLQKADLFISRCGMNSVSENLWFGVPPVLFRSHMNRRAWRCAPHRSAPGLCLLQQDPFAKPRKKYYIRRPTVKMRGGYPKTSADAEAQRVRHKRFWMLSANKSKCGTFFDVPLCVC